MTEPPNDEKEADRTIQILGSLEHHRARVFFRAVTVVTLLVALFLPFLPGPVWLRAATGGACIVASIVCFAFARLAAKKMYTPEIAQGGSVLLVALATFVIYYLGLFSASATLLTVGLYFFGSSQSRRVAWTAYLTAAALYFIATLGIALDLIPDLAVFNVTKVALASRLYRVVMQQVIFGMTFYLARTSRRATEIALDRAQRADLMLKQTEAQLLEAKVDLDRALRPGEGRLSGESVGGYVLGDILGRGGMGEVYAATRKSDQRPFAIKLLHPAMLETPDALGRFTREAEAASRVPSEHVAKVIEIGKTKGNSPFIVMERLEGHDLAWHLRRTPQLDLAAVVELVSHTAMALSAVREAGIVHRDLKPGNLFLTDTLPREWKVLDFGLSKIEDGQALTKDQAVGTPAYMAPEQIQGLKVTHQTDQYALAALAYRALTGQPPFSGDDIPKILMDVLLRMPEPPQAFAKLPVDVELVLAIGLAKRPSDRFEIVEQFAEAFRRAADAELDDKTRAKGWSVLKSLGWGERS